MDFDKNRANFAALTPLSFIFRAADVFPHKPSVIHGDIRHTWGETGERCRRLASALQKRGIVKGDTVAVMAPNVPAMLEAHFGVPMAARCSTRSTPGSTPTAIAFMLDHGEAKVLLDRPRILAASSAARWTG